LAKTDWDRTTVTLDPVTRALADDLVETHKSTFSELVRGLLILDSLVFKGSLEGLDVAEIPEWLQRDYPLDLVEQLFDVREHFVPEKAKPKKIVLKKRK
jgi:hypothetical protein